VRLLVEALGLDAAAHPELALPQASLAPPLSLSDLPIPPAALVAREHEIAVGLCVAA
jgi:hypothetical protein